jgi:hypothetical protein
MGLSMQLFCASESGATGGALARLSSTPFIAMVK